jgi:uncharacterized DUF497 family protein
MPQVITLEWDAQNEAHATRHGVSRAELDELVAYGLWVMVSDTGGRGDRRRLIGQTRRFVTLVLEWTGAPGRYRPITAWPATPREIRLYWEHSRLR